jgi:uncharacterized OB-fold protein
MTLPVFPPTPSPESQPYWDATAEGKILLPRCNDCGTVIWYPRTTCPECMSSDVSWFEASGRGTIYSFAIVRRQGGPWRDALPYVLAYVELDEGPRVLTNIVDELDLEIGQAVEAVFHDTGEGNALVRFRPVSSAR